MAIGRESPIPNGPVGPGAQLAISRDRIVDEIARGRPLAEILETITRYVEQESPGMRSSILLYDRETSRLHIGAAPSLQPSFLRVLDGLYVDEKTGACGAAVHRGRVVVAEDLSVDPLGRVIWPLLDEFELRSVVSAPVLDSNGRVVATIATYSARRGPPPGGLLELLDSLRPLTAIAIEARRNADRVGALTRDLARVNAARHDEMRGLLGTLTTEDLPSIVGAEHALAEVVRGDGPALHDADRARITEAIRRARDFEEVADEVRRYVNSTDRRLERAWVQPAEVAREAWNALGPIREGRQASVRIDTLPTCFADPVMLRDLFTELMSNAVRSVRDRNVCHVEVTSSQPDEGTVFTVRDDGPGGRDAGTGDPSAEAGRSTPASRMSLSIACTIVERHGGTMWVRSRPGAGHAISFTLPARSGEGKPAWGIDAAAYAPPPR